MVTLKSPEEVSEVPEESDPSEKDLAHWFFYTPCAGVTYYSFEARPTRLERVEPRASGDTEAGIP